MTDKNIIAFTEAALRRTAAPKSFKRGERHAEDGGALVVAGQRRTIR